MPDSPTTERVLAGRYRLVRLVARGGMAEVWEAHDDVLARPVAVKCLHPHLAADPAFRERFRREAIAAARLVHPGIVATYDAGVDGGEGFIVMELVRGTSLRDARREQGWLGCAAAVDIVAQVADALDYSHRAGIVHRDVKPGNVLLDGGRAKVADFGIAKAAGDGDATRTGGLLGTAAYLAPEQVDGRPVDARADVYGLGAVLYELLCGRPPFVGDSDVAVAAQRLHADPVPPRHLRAGIPRPLEAVVLRALARDPDDRYASAADLRSALVAVDLTDDAAPMVERDPTPPGGIVPSFRQSERPWLVPAAVIVFVALVLGVAGVLFARTDVGGDLLRPGRDRAGSSGARPAAAALAIAEVRTFDPFDTSGAGEHDGDLPKLLDGDPATAWRTDRYQRADLGGLKPGVGVVIRLARRAGLQRLEVRSPTTGWDARVFVAGEPEASLEDWGEPVAARAGIAGDATFDLRGREGAAVLVWITKLGPFEGAFATQLAEVRLEG